MQSTIEDTSPEESRRLLWENKTLKAEKESLLAQLNELVEIKQQLQEFQIENDKLNQDVSRLRIDCDEKQKRLLLITSVNEDLVSKQKAQNSGEDDSVIELRLQLDRERVTSKNQITKLEQLLKQTQADYQNLSRDFERKNQALFSAAAPYLKQTFDSIESLTDFFLHAIPQSSAPVQDDSESLKQIQDLKHKVKSLKKALKESDAKNEELSTIVTSSKKQDDQIVELETQIRELQHQAQITKIQHDADLNSRDAQLKASQARVSKLQQKLVVQKDSLPEREAENYKIEALNSEIESLRQETQQQRADLFSAAITLDKQRKTNKILSKSVEDLERSLKKEKKRVERLVEELQLISEANSQQEDELSRLSTEKAEKEKELASALATVNSNTATLKQQSSKLADLEAELSDTKQAAAQLQTTVAKQKEELAKLDLDKSKLADEVKKQQLLANQQSSTIASLEANLSNTKARLQEKEPEYILESIPPSSFFVPEMPPEIAGTINTIAKSDAPAGTKIKQVLTAVQSHSQHVIQDLDKERLALQEQNDHFLTGLKTFLDQIRPLSDGVDSISFVEEDEQRVALGNKILKMKDAIGSLQPKFDEVTGTFANLQMMLNTNGLRDTTQAVEDLLSANDKAKCDLQNIKSAIKQIRQEYEAKIGVLEAQIQEDKEALTKDSETIEQLLSHQAILEGERDASRKRSNELQSQLNEIETAHEKEIDDLVEQEAEKRQESISRQNNEREQMKNDYSKKCQELRKVQADYQQLVDENERLRQTRRVFKRTIKEQDQIISEMSASFDRKERSLRDKFSTQLAAIQRESESRVSQVSNQEEVDQIQQAFEEVESKVATLQQQNAKIENERQELAIKVAVHSEEMERERKITATKLKAMEMKAEMRARNDEEEKKAFVEQEKCRIFHFVALQLKQFCDIRREINEDSFKSTVLKAKAEIERLSKQETTAKKILKLGATERLEDALRQLISGVTMM